MPRTTIRSEDITDLQVKTGDIAAIGVTNAKVADDAVGIDELSATGTASATTYLRGDNAWSSIDTGTSWQAVQTSGFTAVAGNGYPCNTTGGAFTAILPASASVGDTIEFVDYAGTFGDSTKQLTLDPQSLNLKGATTDLDMRIARQGIRITYVDATQGWVSVTGVNETAPALTSIKFVTATGPDGGSGTNDGDYKYHTFTASKTGANGFVVSDAGNALGSNTVEYLVIAGAGGGGSGRQTGAFYGGGGGGAGGYKTATGLACPAVGNHDITVGAGGAGGTAVTDGSGDARGVTGSDSSFDDGVSIITSLGGGGGGGGNEAATGVYKDGYDGGSGGGGAAPAGEGGAGTAGQGYAGGDSTNGYGGPGGGGSSAVGTTVSSGNTGGAGGAGTASSINAVATTRAGGGGGGCYLGGTPGAGGSGGGGAGGAENGWGIAGTVNTGSGSGGSSRNTGAGTNPSGGSGVVIIRYKYQ